MLLLWKVEKAYFVVIGCSDFVWWDDLAKIIFLSKFYQNQTYKISIRIKCKWEFNRYTNPSVPSNCSINNPYNVQT